MPECTKCNAPLRPNVLMFGDWDWMSERSDAQEARYRQWLRDVSGMKLAIIEIGSGLGVPTLRHECERVLSDHIGRAHLIRVNPREQELLSQAAMVKDKLGGKGVVPVRLGALEALRQLL